MSRPHILRPPVYHEGRIETTTPTTDRRSAVLGFRLIWAVAVVCGLGLAAMLGWANESVPFAVGIGALVFVGMVRPDLGALALIALASVDLIGTAEVGRFTIRASQVAAIGTAVGLGLRLIRRCRLLEAVRGMPAPVVIFLLFGVAAAARLFFLGAPNAVRGYGYAAWAVFDAIVVAGGLSLVLASTTMVVRALRTWVVSVTAISLFGLLQWTIGVLGGEPPFVAQWMGAVPRINGLSYEPSYFAFSTSIGLALAVVGLVGRGSFLRPIPLGACAASMVVVLAIASSRSGWIGGLLLTAVLVVLAWVRWPRLGRGQRWGIALVASAYVVAAALITSQQHLYAEKARGGLDLSEVSSSAPRIEGVLQALDMARQRPVVGVGLGQFGGTLSASRSALRSEQEIDGIVTFNLYAELLAETGLLGILLVLWGVFLCGRSGWWVWRNGGEPLATSAAAVLLAGVLVFGVMYQFNQTLFRTDVWCLLGLALAVQRAEVERRRGGSTVEPSGEV